MAMKASRIAVLIAILAVLASLALSTLSSAAPDELLVNGGFEDGVAGWEYSGGLMTYVNNPVHSGDRAAILIVNDEEGCIYQTVPIAPGESYNFAGYVTKDDTNIEKIFLRIRWYQSDDGSGAEILHIVSEFLMSDHPDYHPLTLTGTAPPYAHSATVECVIKLVDMPTGPAIAYFDDMSFTGPAASTPTPTATPTPTSTPTPTPTIAPTPTASPTPTPIATSTSSPTLTPTSTLTPTPTPVLTGTTAERGDVLINEIGYDPPQSGPDADFEWLEIYNPTDNTIELGGWTISDNYGSDPVPSLTLPDGGFVVIAATEGFYTNFLDFDGTIVFLQDGRIGNGLNNDGDCLILEDSMGNVIDAISYGDETSQSTYHSDVAAGHSLERSPPGGEFVDNSAPTPGQGLYPLPTPAPSTTSTLVPAPTPTPTPVPMLTTTPAPTITSSPTPQPSNGGTSFSAVGVRAVLIVIAIACLGIGLWLRRRSKK